MILDEIKNRQEVVWINPGLDGKKHYSIGRDEILDAEERLQRFAPFIMKAFPETAARGGLIESELLPLKKMSGLPAHSFLKDDAHLAIAGSVKARGGIYEVLKHTETLALENGLLSANDDYAVLADKRDFFENYKVQVGSTGNLGLSIGIMSAKIGYRVIVHMSADAKQWKKDLLRSKGVTVMEYESDYGTAVANGRKLSDEDPSSYFVDDENSLDLFLGYSVAARRLVPQFREQGITVDDSHPLFVYIPCGVGGAPGGITFGLRTLFGKNVHVFFVEPLDAPCFTIAMASGRGHDVSIDEYGLKSTDTQADGLAVGRASSVACDIMKSELSGCITLNDKTLFKYLHECYDKEQIFLEPSACAGFAGPARLSSEEMKGYINKYKLTDLMENSTHVIWATGGMLVPEKEKEGYLNV
ncbi:MAG: D-serine ammonia-lyase [Eubacteriaceae bacterium]|jgi:D-serine dehydratase|nr:D-serine ammonia-lyase [Eubacteriaceae bacterium]